MRHENRSSPEHAATPQTQPASAPNQNLTTTTLAVALHSGGDAQTQQHLSTPSSSIPIPVTVGYVIYGKDE